MPPSDVKNSLQDFPNNNEGNDLSEAVEKLSSLGPQQNAKPFQQSHNWWSNQSFLTSARPLTMSPLIPATPRSLVQAISPQKDEKVSTGYVPLVCHGAPQTTSLPLTLSNTTMKLSRIPAPKTFISSTQVTPSQHDCATKPQQKESVQYIRSQPSMLDRAHKQCCPARGRQLGPPANNASSITAAASFPAQAKERTLSTCSRSLSAPPSHSIFPRNSFELQFDRKGGPEDWQQEIEDYRCQHILKPTTPTRQTQRSQSTDRPLKRLRSPSEQLPQRRRKSSQRLQNGLDRNAPFAHPLGMKACYRTGSSRFPLPPFAESRNFCHIRNLSSVNLTETESHPEYNPMFITHGGSTDTRGEILCGVPKMLKEMAQGLGEAIFPIKEHPYVSQHEQRSAPIHSATNWVTTLGSTSNGPWCNVGQITSALTGVARSNPSSRSTKTKSPSRHLGPPSKRCYQATVVGPRSPRNHARRPSRRSPVSRRNRSHHRRQSTRKTIEQGKGHDPFPFPKQAPINNPHIESSRCLQAVPISHNIPFNAIGRIRVVGNADKLCSQASHSASVTATPQQQNIRRSHPGRQTRWTQSTPIHASILESLPYKVDVSDRLDYPLEFLPRPVPPEIPHLVTRQYSELLREKVLTTPVPKSQECCPPVTQIKPPPPVSPRASGIAVPRALEVDMTEVQIDKLIGKGATSEVFKGQWRGSDVAIKKLLTEPNELVGRNGRRKTAALKDFYRELGIMLRLRHPNLVLFMGTSTRAKPLCVITEYCAGGNLFELLHGKISMGSARRPRLNLSWPQKFRICLDIARAGFYLHASTPPIIHRDLKSLNILLAEKVNATGDVPFVKVRTRWSTTVGLQWRLLLY